MKKLIDYIKRNHGKAVRTLATVLAVFIVFTTTYSLILPAITIEQDVADQEPGLVLAEESQGTSGTLDGEVTSAPDDKTAADIEVFAEAKDSEPTPESTEEATAENERNADEESDTSINETESDAQETASDAADAQNAEDRQSDEAQTETASDDEADGQSGGSAVSGVQSNTGNEESTAASAADAPTEMPAVTFEADTDKANKAKEDNANIHVTVEAQEGTFPAGTTMKVKEVSDDRDVVASVEKAIEDSDEVTGEIRAMQAVDISFYNKDGDEIEPLKEIRVTLSANLIKEAEDPVLVHVPDKDSKDDQDKEPEIIKQEDEISEPDKAEDEIIFLADEFSVYAIVYTVDFHWEVNGRMYEFSLPGGGFVSFTDLVEVLGIAKQDVNGDFREEVDGSEATGEDGSADDSTARDFVKNIANVEFSDESLVKVAHITEDITALELKDQLGVEPEYSAELSDADIAENLAQKFTAPDWALVSLKAFDSEETLTITMKNGEQFVVKVTDAQVIDNISALSGVNGYYYIYTVSKDSSNTNRNYALKYDGSTGIITSTSSPNLGTDFLWHIVDNGNGSWTADNNGQYLSLTDGLTTNNQSSISIVAFKGDSGTGFTIQDSSTKSKVLSISQDRGSFVIGSDNGARIRLLSSAAPTYTFTVTVNDSTKGTVKGTTSSNVDSGKVSSYTAITKEVKNGVANNNNSITASPIGNCSFDHWELDGVTLTGDDFSTGNIDPDKLQITHEGAVLTAVFTGDPGTQSGNTGEDHTEDLQSWIKSMTDKQPAINKTAKEYDYANRIYQIDLSASSGMYAEKKDIELVLVTDASGSMKFPATLVPDSSKSFTAARNLTQKLDTSKVYYIMGNRVRNGVTSADATVFAVKYRRGSWQFVDASKYYDSQNTTDFRNISARVDSTGNSLRLYVDDAHSSTNGYYQLDGNIYTAANDRTRLSYLQEAVTAATQVVYGVNNDAKIGLVTFNKTATAANGGDFYSSSQIEALNGKVNTISTDGNTDQRAGLNAANGFWTSSQDSSKQRVVVLITDGAPNPSSGTLTWTQIQSAARGLETNKGATVYTVGLSLGNVPGAEAGLRDTATNSSYAFKAENGDELVAAIKNIVRSLITEATMTGDVKDTLDAAFYPVKADGTPVQNGETIDGASWTENADHTWTVTWQNQEFNWPNGTTPGWSKSVYVKTREDYLGGNTIKTNSDTEDGDQIHVTGYKTNTGSVGTLDFTKKFDTPHVNVDELHLTHHDTSITVKLGDTVNSMQAIKDLYDSIDVCEVVKDSGDDHRMIAKGDMNPKPVRENYPDEDQYNEALKAFEESTETFKLSAIAPMKDADWIKLLKATPSGDGSRSIDIPYSGYGHDSGSIRVTLKQELTGEEPGVSYIDDNTLPGEHETKVVGNGVEKYTLTVTYIPKPEESVEYHTTPGGSRGDKTGNIESVNTHIVNVTPPKLIISKVWDDNLYTVNRPESVSFDILKNGERIGEITLTAADQVSGNSYRWEKETSFELEEGAVYTLQEKNADYHYDFETESFKVKYSKGQLTAEGDANSDGTLTAINRMRGSVTITKEVVDKDGHKLQSEDGYEIFPDAEFTFKLCLKDSDGQNITGKTKDDADAVWYRLLDTDGTQMRDADGKLIADAVINDGDTVKLKAGQSIRLLNVSVGTKYKVEEVTAQIPNGYEHSDPDQYTYMDASLTSRDKTPDSSGYYSMQSNAWEFGTVTNKYKYANIAISKVDAADTNNKLANAKFKLYKDAAGTQPAKDIDGNTFAEVTTDANGFAAFHKVPDGTYYLIETEAPANYTKADPIEITVEKSQVTYRQDNNVLSVTGEGILYNSENNRYQLTIIEGPEEGQTVGTTDGSRRFSLDPHKQIDYLGDEGTDSDGLTSVHKNDSNAEKDLYRLYLDATMKKKTSKTNIIFVEDYSSSMTLDMGDDGTRYQNMVKALVKTGGFIDTVLQPGSDNALSIIKFSDLRDTHWNGDPVNTVKDGTDVVLDWTTAGTTETLNDGIKDDAREIVGIEYKTHPNGAEVSQARKNEKDFSRWTNYEAALNLIDRQIKALDDDRKDYPTIVFFMSDGLPTSYIGPDGRDRGGYLPAWVNNGVTIPEWGNYKLDFNESQIWGQEVIQNLVTMENTPGVLQKTHEAIDKFKRLYAKELKNHQLIINAIGFSSDMSDDIYKDDRSSFNVSGSYPKKYIYNNPDYLYPNKPNNQGKLQRNSVLRYLADEVGEYADAANGQELAEKLNILLEIKTISQVSISDTLSDYVELYAKSPDFAVMKTVRNEDGTTAATKLTVTSDHVVKDGNKIIGHIVWNPTERRVALNFDGADFTYEDGDKYELSFNVEASSKAYEEHAKSGYGSSEGDENTDRGSNATSSGADGFYSNKVATVTYKYGDEPGTRTEYYPYPVIQVGTTKLQIKKDWDPKAPDGVTSIRFKLFAQKPGETRTQILNPDMPDGSFVVRASDGWTLTIDKLNPKVLSNAATGNAVYEPIVYTVEEVETYDKYSTSYVYTATETQDGSSFTNITSRFKDDQNNDNVHEYYVPGVSDPAEGGLVKILNERAKPSIIVKKTDSTKSGTDRFLAGAKFSLYKVEGSDVLITELDFKNAGTNVKVALDAEGKFIVPPEGILISGLQDGNYKLVEREAPAGYIITNNTTTFTVTNGQVIDWSIAGATGASVEIPNEPGVALPAAGGSGTKVFIILGSILITAAGVGLVMRKRKRVS